MLRPHSFVPYDAKKPVRPVIKKTGRAIKNYFVNVSGGAKIVGEEIKKTYKNLFK